MTRRMILPIVALMTGCASAAIDTRLPGQQRRPLSICELANSAKLVEGAVVHVAARYKTDKSHYEYLIDPACGKSGVINISNLGLVPNESVKKFYDSADRFCADQGAPYICVLDVTIEAELRIVRGQNGKLAVDILQVFTASPFP